MVCKVKLGNQTYNLKKNLGKGFYILRLKTEKATINDSLVIIN